MILGKYCRQNNCNRMSANENISIRKSVIRYYFVTHKKIIYCESMTYKDLFIFAGFQWVGHDDKTYECMRR